MAEPEQAPSTAARPPGRWWRGVPRPVWLATALFGTLLAAYAVMFPTYRGPDEPQHVDLTLLVREAMAYPALGDRFLADSVVRSMEVVRFGRDSRNLTAAAAPPPDRRPALANLEDVDADPDRINQMPQHPPLYYAAMAGATAVADALTPGSTSTRPFDGTVGLMRVLNVLLLLPVPLLAFLVVRRLGGTAEAGLAAAILPAAIPQLAHIGSVVNNDNLLTLLAGVLTVLLVGVARGALSPARAAGVGLVAGAALLTKAFALVAPVWVGAAYLLGGRRTGSRGRAWTSLAIAAGTMLAVGGWWWIRNVIIFGRPQPGLGRLADAPASFQPDALWWLRRFGAWMVERFWGWFGWFDVRMPLVAIAIAAAVVGIGVLAAAALRRRGWTAGEIALLLLPLLGIGLMVGIGAYRTYARTGITPAIQGRYLFPGVVGLAAATALGLSALPVRARRWLPLALLGGAGLMHLLAARAVIPFYWGPAVPTSVGERLRAMLAWSPWPAPVWWGIVGLILALGVWLAVELARRPAPSAPPND